MVLTRGLVAGGPASQAVQRRSQTRPVACPAMRSTINNRLGGKTQLTCPVSALTRQMMNEHGICACAQILRAWASMRHACRHMDEMSDAMAMPLTNRITDALSSTWHGRPVFRARV